MTGQRKRPLKQGRLCCPNSSWHEQLFLCTVTCSGTQRQTAGHRACMLPPLAGGGRTHVIQNNLRACASTIQSSCLTRLIGRPGQQQCSPEDVVLRVCSTEHLSTLSIKLIRYHAGLHAKQWHGQPSKPKPLPQEQSLRGRVGPPMTIPATAPTCRDHVSAGATHTSGKLAQQTRREGLVRIWSSCAAHQQQQQQQGSAPGRRR